MFIVLRSGVCFSQVEQFANLVQTGAGGGYISSGLGRFGQNVYFAADDGVHGIELWRSNGTREGTRMVQDLVQGPQGSAASVLGAAGNFMYFSVFRNGVQELWKVDGNDQTSRVLSFPANRFIMHDSSTAAWKNELYFTLEDSSNWSKALWKTDGTGQNTYPLMDVEAQELTPTGRGVFFSAYSSSYGWELWITEGTPGGTRIVKDLSSGPASSHPHSLLVFGNELIFLTYASDQGALAWHTDGTSSGTLPISHFSPAGSLARLGNEVVAAANDSNGTELWKFDSSFEASLLKDINPGPKSSHPSLLGSTETTTFFTAYTPAHGRELWVTDGTSTGTHLVKDLVPGKAGMPSWDTLEHHAFSSQRLFFLFGIRDLWVSDGTEAGTHTIGEAYPYDFGVTSQAVGSTLYYLDWNRELSRSDGTLAGTQLVARIGSNDGSSSPSFLKVLGTKLYFSASLPGEEGLFRTDGSSYPEFLVRGRIELIERMNPTTLIFAKDWTMYSFREGTPPVRLTPKFDYIFAVAAAGGRIFFEPNSGPLWVTDGTRAGTRTVDIPGGTTVSSRCQPANGRCYFITGNWYEGNFVWEVPPSSFTARKLYKFPPNTYINYFNAVDGRIFFVTTTVPSSGYSIWYFDFASNHAKRIGTAPESVLKVFPAYPNLYFASGSSSEGNIWRLDLEQKKFYKVMKTGGADSVTFLGLTGSQLIFINSGKLLQSDGTPGGTSELANMRYASNAFRIGNVLYFSGNDPGTGSEPWVTDGTPAGTRRLADIYDGPYDSFPQYFTSFNNQIWFSAMDALTGRELWRFRP